MKSIEIAIIGNPNSGKTTLFNALTGEKQQVGNWPGVTVEQKIGHLKTHHHKLKLVDLPGVYSLMIASEEASLDERIAYDYLQSHESTLIINVIDASNLERNLYLTLQLLEMGIPVVIALNMMDIVRKKKLSIDVEKLSQYLRCPVIPLEATKKRSIKTLKEAILHYALNLEPSFPPFAYPAEIEKAVNALVTNHVRREGIANFQTTSQGSVLRHFALRLLENDCLALQQVSLETRNEVEVWQKKLQDSLTFDADILIAEARYAFIGDLISHIVKQEGSLRDRAADKLDKIVLNRFLGLPIFLFIMYGMFAFSITIGGFLQDYFDAASDYIFVQWPIIVLNHLSAPSWLTLILADGLGKGLNTVATFIPVISCMFLALSFLEQSGYMARAAFVIDRVMRFLGLPGKSFVPMIVGFGCNVPAVLAARTLENKRDRILTVLMTPFMSCGARLTIFAVFIAAFFPKHGAIVVFLLYVIGIVIAILTGFILRKTLLKGQSSPWVLELPSYHWPTFRSLRLHTWHRLHGFVIRAGLLIVPICMLIGVLNSFMVGEISLLSVLGQWLTPVFSPMGIMPDNWPATVGLLTGLLAKEVVIGTLNSLYAQLGATDVMGQMMHYFGGVSPAFAYLLFVLLYFPCVSTTAAVAREIGRGWAIFSVLWSTFIAYGMAVFYYQATMWSHHSLISLSWMLGISATYFLTFVLLKCYSPKEVIAVPQTSAKTRVPARCEGCPIP